MKYAEIELTNRGGDIVSYKLLNHIDVDTKEGIQMVDNVTEFNRACALAFGDEKAGVLNDLFNVKKEGENTYLFTKNYSIKNEDGTTAKFILGKSNNILYLISPLFSILFLIVSILVFNKCLKNYSSAGS